jgi:putative MATE family efflux protein
LILHGSIVKTIFLLSVPTLMMALVNSLMPIIDGLFINNIAGTIVASSITYCFPIVNMASAVAQGLSVAGMAMIGQTNGRGDFEQAKHLSAQLVIFSFILGCLVAPILVLVSFPIAGHVDAAISHDVFVYLSLNSLVIPFSFLESIYNSIKNASGKPEATFIRMVLMLILKIIFNIVFIAILRWGIVGAVMASLASNILICVWMYYELFVMKNADRLEINGFRFDFGILRDLVRLGIPSILSSVMLNLGFVLINNEVQKYGPIVLNAQGISGNITSVCFQLPSAYGAAITTMVSMNVGAGQGKKARKSTLVGCVISAITAVVIVAIVVPLSSYLTVLFTRETEVLDIANRALHIYTYSVLGFGVCMIMQGAFVGLGRMKIPLVMSILRIWLLRYLFILATESYLGFYSVFWGNLFSNYMAAAIIALLMIKISWVSSIPGRALSQGEN